MPLEHEVTERLKAEADQKVRDAYKNLFAGADGEAVISDLIKFCFIFAQTLEPGSPDHTAYREGKRAVGMRILGMSGKLGAMRKSIGV